MKKEALLIKHNNIHNEIAKVIKGKDIEIDKTLMAMYASGNVLLEDNPGTGKTTLAKTIACAMDLEYNRQQFTPDTMPTDIVGYTYYEKDLKETKYMPGVVFCNILLADEINRTSAKTQAALLEAMEEKNITIDGQTKPLPDPFFVIATQNPNTSMGTQPLPDSQCDRFIIKISIGYPDMESECDILMNRTLEDTTANVKKVINGEELKVICQYVDSIYVARELATYICNLVDETRNNSHIEVGLSTRAAIALKRMSCAHAFVNGRDYVIPEDVQAVFYDVANHRIILNSIARMEDRTEKMVLDDIIKKVKPEKVII